MSNLAELKKQYEKLGEEIKKIESKDWPDSWEEAFAEGGFWGFWNIYNGSEKRYAVINTGNLGGCTVSGAIIFAYTDDMKEFWNKETSKTYSDYGFKQFESNKALAAWMAGYIE